MIPVSPTQTHALSLMASTRAIQLLKKIVYCDYVWFWRGESFGQEYGLVKKGLVKRRAWSREGLCQQNSLIKAMVWSIEGFGQEKGLVKRSLWSRDGFWSIMGLFSLELFFSKYPIGQEKEWVNRRIRSMKGFHPEKSLVKIWAWSIQGLGKYKDLAINMVCSREGVKKVFGQEKSLVKRWVW